MPIQITREGNLIRVSESTMSFTATVTAHWYFDLVAQLRSHMGRLGEKPSQPMTEEELAWVTKNYLPALFSNQEGLLPPPEQDPLWKQRQLVAHAFWFGYMHDPSAAGRPGDVDRASSIAAALLNWSADAIGRAVQGDPAYVYCECPSDWTPRAGIAFIAKAFGLPETAILARAGIHGQQLAEYEVMQDSWAWPSNRTTAERQRSRA